MPISAVHKASSPDSVPSTPQKTNSAPAQHAVETPLRNKSQEAQAVNRKRYRPSLYFSPKKVVNYVKSRLTPRPSFLGKQNKNGRPKDSIEKKAVKKAISEAISCSCGKGYTPFAPGWVNHLKSCSGTVSCQCKSVVLDTKNVALFDEHVVESLGLHF